MNSELVYDELDFNKELDTLFDVKGLYSLGGLILLFVITWLILIIWLRPPKGPLQRWANTLSGKISQDRISSSDEAASSRIENRK